MRPNENKVHRAGAANHPPRSQFIFDIPGVYRSFFRFWLSQSPPIISLTRRKLMGFKIHPSNCASLISFALDSGSDADTANIGIRLLLYRCDEGGHALGDLCCSFSRICLVAVKPSITGISRLAIAVTYDTCRSIKMMSHCFHISANASTASEPFWVNMTW